MSRSAVVVDDEPDIREIARLALETVAGWRVTLGSGGSEAVELVAREQPDVVLLDVMMPDLDGPAVARLLAADVRTAHVPVVLLTARVTPSEVAGLKEGPVAAVLAKPFDPMTLAADVGRVLGW
jgi:CheY-like chemotaxis protein